MLNSRLVGVTAGLGTWRTLSWIGRRNTAPETPTGAVTVATVRPAAKLSNPTTATFTSELSQSAGGSNVAAQTPVAGFVVGSQKTLVGHVCGG